MSSEEWRQKVGRLVGSEYDRRSKKWQHKIYFEYDNDLMKNLKKSSLFGVESHESTNQKKAMTVLRTVYTEIFDNRLNMRKNFPGVIQDPNDEVKRAQGVFRELMGNPHDVEKDPVAHAKWEEEIGSSGQTKISILAEHTGLSLDGGGKVRKNYQRPRVGADVEILDKDGLDSIYNKSGDVVSIGLGKLHGVDLEIKLDVRKMVTQHSGLFGSTGAGKSNMVSNIIRKLVGGSANVVVFDIEEEYSALLADCFDDDHRFIAFVDEDSIPYDMKQHMKGVVVNAEEAAKEYVEQMSDKMPDELAKHKENFVPVFKKMIEEKRIRFLAPREMVKISDFITQVLGDYHEIPGLEESTSGMCRLMQKWKDKEYGDRVNGFNINTLSNFRSDYEKKYNDLLGKNEYVAQGMQMFERDIDLVDVLTYFEQSSEVDVIQCHVEGIVDGDAFVETASRISKEKPIVLLKAGRSETGRLAVASHSGAAAGENEVYDAAFRKAGIVPACNSEELRMLSKAFVTHGWATDRGHRPFLAMVLCFFPEQ